MSRRLLLVTSPDSTAAGAAVPGGQVRTHAVVGDPDQVRAAMARAHADGRLVGLTHGEQLPGGLVRVTAELRDPTPTSRWRRIRPWLTGAAVLLGVAAVAALVWLLVLAVLALVAAVTAAAVWVKAHLLLLGAGALILLALVFSAGRSSSCSGVHIHCRGCRR